MPTVDPQFTHRQLEQQVDKSLFRHNVRDDSVRKTILDNIPDALILRFEGGSKVHWEIWIPGMKRDPEQNESELVPLEGNENIYFGGPADDDWPGSRLDLLSKEVSRRRLFP